MLSSLNEPNSGGTNGDTERANDGNADAAQIRAEVEAEFQQKVKSLIEDNSAYKGLQTALNKSQQSFQSQLQAKEAELAALRGQTSEMASGMDFLSETVINALSPEDKAVVMEKLQRRQVSGLEKQINDLRKAVTQPAQQTMPTNDYAEQYKAALLEAQDALEDAVQSHGLDPKAKGLDYGSTDDTFAKRLKVLNASIKVVQKAKDEADVDGVRQTVPVTPTRQTGGVPIDPKTDGKSLGDRAFEDVWARMQREASGKKR